MYERYCEIRDARGFTDYEIAKKTGINPATFSDWKKGKSAPKVEKLAKIAAVLDTSIDYLVTGCAKGQSGPTIRRELLEKPGIWELLAEAEKANADDLRAVTETLRRLNAYAMALAKLGGKNA